MFRRLRILDLTVDPHDHRVFERLRVRYPLLRLTAEGAEIPLGDGTPEEVLAICREEEVPVRSSRVRSARGEGAPTVGSG